MSFFFDWKHSISVFLDWAFHRIWEVRIAWSKTWNTESSDLSLGQNHDDHQKDAFNDENEAKQVDFSWWKTLPHRWLGKNKIPIRARSKAVNLWWQELVASDKNGQKVGQEKDWQTRPQSKPEYGYEQFQTIEKSAGKANTAA